MSRTILLDGASLTLDDVHAVAVGGARVGVAEGSRSRSDRSRSIVEKLAASGEAVYGVTTGFGKLSDIAIPPDRLRELQVNLIRSHAAGVGPPLSIPETRAMMLLRANVLAKGFSGARGLLAERLVAMLNAAVHPVIPEQGSCGASGDLAPLSHLALAIIGEGEVHGDRGPMPARDALARAGIAPTPLEAKEGISLINGTQAHTGIAALSLIGARRLWHAAHVAGAMTLEALRGTPVAFDDRIHAARGQRGQRRSAALLRDLLADSEIRESHRENDPRVQDAYSLRCMPQVHGAALDALEFTAGIVSREINAATDNPLVFESGEILSGGNFHGQPVAMALDVMAIALTHLAVIAERRIDRLVNPDLNEGLPPFLAAEAGVNSGYMMAQVTAAALTSECKLLAHPSSVDSIPTDGGKEDVVPMAMGAAWKLRRILANVQHVIAIELMCAAQGVDYRAPLRPGRGVVAAHRVVRQRVAPLGADRILAPDIAALAQAVAAGELGETAFEGAA